MERKANYVLIGLFTFAVVAGAFGFVFWIHQTAGKKQSVIYRVIFDSSVSGLHRGGPVLFNGIRVGEVTDLQLSADKPSEVTATLQVNKATPIRSDTHVGLEFTGLTGIASVSLKGVSATTPLIEREEGEPPTLKAELNRQPGSDERRPRHIEQCQRGHRRQSGRAESGSQGSICFHRCLGAQCGQHRRDRE